MKRVVAVFSVAAVPALLITAIGYVLSQRRPGHLKETFGSQWDAILGSLTLLTLGLMGLGQGLWLCFSVLGGFQDDNVRKGAVLATAGLAVGVLGAILLWTLLVP